MSLYQLLKNLIPYVKPYRWIVALTLALTLAGSLTAQVNAWVLRYTVDRIAEMLTEHKALRDGLNIMFIISVILIAKEFLNAFIQFGQKFYGEKIRICIARDLAQRCIEKVLSYRLAFFTTSGNQPGKLQTRIDRGIENITRLVQNFFIDILPLFANAIVALVMMFNANFYVGLVGLCIAPIYFWISIRQAKKLSGSRWTIKELRENKSHGILNMLESIMVIKSFVRERIEEDKQLHLQNDLTDTQMKIRKISFLFDGFKSFTEQIGVVIIIILTAYLVLTGQMTIGAIMFHILLFNNVSAPIRQLHRIYDQMNDALIYSGSFFEIMHANKENEPSGTYRPEKIIGDFELRNVSFTYPGNKEPTLKNINMTISHDISSALVGLSGAGKSTLINLLDKYFLPDEGVILLDGVPLNDYDTSYLREHIGLVLQKNHIFNGTIEENIRYGNPEANHEEVIEAARKSFVHEQIIMLPDNYQTSALELSGGQQQKIAIARMFLKNPPIIFLDEPTASLDAVSTEQIKNSMDAIKKGRTVITISHSISQIIDAGIIYVMKQGYIIEKGTHEELYHLDGAYREIFDAMARSMNFEKISKTID